MNHWNNIIIHHSASGWGTAHIIDLWHRQPPRNWLGIGYHFVILNGYTNSKDWKARRCFSELIGQIEIGRTLDGDQWVQGEEIGAQALGFNDDSIGVCLIHNTEQYHPTMIASLLRLIKGLMLRYSIKAENVLGHCEVDPVNKPLCPGLDMNIIRGFL